MISPVRLLEVNKPAKWKTKIVTALAALLTATSEPLADLRGYQSIQ